MKFVCPRKKRQAPKSVKPSVRNVKNSWFRHRVHAHISTKNSIFEPFQKCHIWHFLKVKIIPLVPLNESVQTVSWKITILMWNHLKNFLSVDSHWLGDFFCLFWLVNSNLTYSAEVDLNKLVNERIRDMWLRHLAWIERLRCDMVACRTVTCWAKQF